MRCVERDRPNLASWTQMNGPTSTRSHARVLYIHSPKNQPDLQNEMDTEWQGKKKREEE